ncbi:NAD(P)H-binding protein [Rhizobacter sp. Root1221]|uniref:NAD(P)H-binding protein n=1 Tax=Rhizobacter sp. Root1221 TaxID=1736433 RepID=UPI0007004059|nr:NAD(P)H-binding protein [Rhizobacter sp. Root1221]KQW01549.1 hypothetical protein ASC87_14525 [Rhizobacter sp. Root1221]
MVTFTAPVPDPRRARTAWVAGSTGLIGSQLLPMLLAQSSYRMVHALVRRLPSHPVHHDKLRHHPVAFNALPVLPSVDDVYIALGTTIKTAGSRTAFRQVDFDAVLATARAAREAGAMRLAVVSALGANARSKVFYNRVKGEMEDAVTSLGFSTVVIARPSLLIGDRAALGQTVRPVEQWGERLLRPVMRFVPRRVRPIEAEAVAAAMLHAMLSGAPGVRRLESAAMQPPPSPPRM